MSLRIYNTLKREKEDFVPIEPGKVKMYVCGPTVYDVLHVGNFRGVVFFNLVRNWLERSGNKVEFVYNYTDVDDKIINKANEEGVASEEIAARYIKEYERDFKALKLKAHDHNPRATQFIQQMIDCIQRLIDNEKAYVIDGEVFYSVDSFKDYGKLSNKDLEELQAGHRIEPDPRKKSPLDFVLWKPSKEGEPAWDASWGKGRPGWHIECSVMVMTLLGETIDIHGGGIDLIFPHHENEIAQSEGATGKPFARYWMHNNFINFGETKMSKSLGNVVTVRAFLDKYNEEIFKYLILSVHYRSPLSMADTQIQQAIAAIARIYSALNTTGDILSLEGKEAPLDEEFKELLERADLAIGQALDDDFNTPAALAQIFEVVRHFNANIPKKLSADPQLKGRAQAVREWIIGYGKLMSLFQEDSKSFLVSLDEILLREKGLEAAAIDERVAARNKARDEKDFAAADAIRDELNQLGIEIQDGVEGTTWQVKKG